MTQRIIAIGDVHGCIDELSRLVSAIAPTNDDRIVMLGDLVNRGPDGRGVVRLCREIGATALLGNHERRLLKAREGRRMRKLGDNDLATFKSLKNDDWEYLEKMLPSYHIPSLNTVFVHGGFLPFVPWNEQGKSIVTMIQVIDEKGKPRKRSDAPLGCPHWSDLWIGPQFVVYGHTPWREVRRTKWTLGLDTGCVYGGALSALVLPANEIVQVNAAKAYYSAPVSWRHVENNTPKSAVARI
jgi:serine/threonine protein phosphatase 1